MKRSHFSLLCLIASLCGLFAGGCHADNAVTAFQAPAHFRITNQVVNLGLEAFTATLPGIGNSLLEIDIANAGFEPIVYRNMYMIQQDAPDLLIIRPETLTQYETLREGFLDGAGVRIYRIENGRFRMVREDRIPQGGFRASGWLPAIPAQRIVPATTPRYLFRWDNHNRPDVPYFFTVRAVARDGRLSQPATAASFVRPEKIGKADPGPPVLIEFRPLQPSVEDKAVPVPTGLRGRLQEDGALLLEWNSLSHPDLAGYIIYRSDHPPESHAGFRIELENKASAPDKQIRAGDLAIVSKKFFEASRKRYFSNRVWGAANETSLLLPSTVNFFPDETPGKSWELVPHPADTPVTDGGETCLKLKLDAGVREIIGRYNHSGKQQNWYPVLEARPYRVEAWMRQEGGGSVRFKFDGFYGRGDTAIPPIPFQVGPEWRRYVATFTPPAVQDNAEPGRMGIEFTGPGTFYIDNLRIYRDDADYLDLLPEELAELNSAGLSALRTHGTVRTKFRTHDMAQLTNDGGAIGGSAKSNSLPQLLRVISKAGMQPWLQVEFHMQPQEWAGFVEYLAAPYDPAVDTPRTKPWAYKRYRQGRERPWTEAFDRIYLELGNETWNRIFLPWVFGAMTDAKSGKRYNPGQVYGMFQEHVIAALRSSPYWTSAGLEQKFVFVLGGWNGQPFGKEAAQMSPSSDYLTVAAYNGGWDEGEGPPRLDAASLFNVLSHVNQAAIPFAEQHRRELHELNARRHKELRLGTYEAGPGYALKGLNNARVTEAQAQEQEQVMKSLAAGTATLDAFLARAYRGFELQNYFGFRPGAYWASHAPWYRGGQAYPSWQLIALFNNHATGAMLQTETLGVPTVDLKPYERRKGIKDAPLTAVYATRKADRHAVIVMSRKVSGYPIADDHGFTPTTVDLPFARAGKLTLYRMAGDPRANNLLSPRNVRIERIELGEWNGGRLTLNAASGADERGLPPAATFMYIFEEVSGKPAG
ncbi:MAG: hypothetical protein AB1443_10100 [Pseudomonadota bacterium]